MLCVHSDRVTSSVKWEIVHTVSVAKVVEWCVFSGDSV